MITRLPIPDPAPAPAPRPRVGKGTLLTVGSAGVSVSAPVARGKYPHPFKPALSLRWVTFSLGLVESFEPVIGKEKISDGARLQLDPKVANQNGESWCCVEVVPNEAGQLDNSSRVEMVHTSSPVSADPAIGRCPVVLILWRDGQPWRSHEIVYFNLRYQRVPLPYGPPRHLFF